jgi:hypothetical protein
MHEDGRNELLNLVDFFSFNTSQTFGEFRGYCPRSLLKSVASLFSSIITAVKEKRKTKETNARCLKMLKKDHALKLSDIMLILYLKNIFSDARHKPDICMILTCPIYKPRSGASMQSTKSTEANCCSNFNIQKVK